MLRKKGVEGVTAEAEVPVFVGRERELQEFFTIFDQKVIDDYRVLSYYGIGGIGKSQFRMELVERLKKEEQKGYAYLNFETEAHQKLENALVQLRMMFGESYKVPFNKFDLTYLLYMKKSAPRMQIKEDAFPYLEEGSIFADLIGIVNNIPEISLFPKMFNLLHKSIKNWKSKEIKSFLESLKVKEAHELLDMLPRVFSQDLSEFIRHNEKKMVIFIDTYEALWQNQRMKAYDFSVDHWVTELVKELPEVLWVILGREQLYWEVLEPEWREVTTQTELDTLTDEETEQLLRGKGITDKEIIEAICRNAEGHPYSIMLARDLYRDIRISRIPIQADFEWDKTPVKLFKRLMKYLMESEKQAMERLALTRTWNYEIYDALMNRFQIQMNRDDFQKLERFSFITKQSDDRWEMHRLMRASLVDYQSKNNFLEGHTFLFQYYQSQLSRELTVSDPFRASHLFDGAFYHGLILTEEKSVGIDTFVDWFRNADGPFLTTSKNGMVISLHKQFIEFLSKRSDLVSQSYLSMIQYDLGYIYMMELRKFDVAEELFLQSLSVRLELFGNHHQFSAKSYHGLATVYHRQGKLEEAEHLYMKALKLREELLKDNRMGVAMTANGLAKLYQENGDLDQAKQYFEYSLTIREEQAKPDFVKISLAKMNLISCCHVRREYEEAAAMLEDVRDLRMKTFGPEHIGIAEVISYTGIVRSAFGDYVEALNLFDEAERFYTQVVGEDCLEVAKVKHNRAILYLLQDERSKAQIEMAASLKIKNTLKTVGVLTGKEVNYRQSDEMRSRLMDQSIAYEELQFNF